METSVAEVAAGGIEVVGSTVSSLMEMSGNVISFIIGHPICLIPIGIFVAGAAVGLFKRIFG